MRAKQGFFAIATGVLIIVLFAIAVVDGLKRQAAKEAEANRYKLRVWELSNNDEQYWKAWSEQRNLFADRLLTWHRFHNLSDKTPPILPHTAEEYLAEYDNPDRKNVLLIERLDMKEFEKVNAEFLKRYPIISLEDRLRYEDDRSKSDDSDVNDFYARKLATRILHDQWNEYYEITEVTNTNPSRPLVHRERLSRGRRHEALETLHREGLRAFANVTAFGYDRTPEINLDDLRIYEKPELVQLPQTVANSTAHYHLDLDGDYNNLAGVEKWVVDNLRKDYPKYMHLAFYHQFTEDIAYAKDFRQAAGFEPHAVRDTVNWSYDLFHPISNPLWHVQRMELVSLLKFKEPAVYISDMLPNMKQLVDGKTRPLDEFESEAMQKIYGGEFIATKENDLQMRMVGAVRAGETCVQCHAVKSGELLGAFSYILQR